MLRSHRRDSGGQGHGAQPPRRHSRRLSQTYAFHVPRHEDTPDPTREGNCRRIHLQVSFRNFKSLVYEFIAFFNVYRWLIVLINGY